MEHDFWHERWRDGRIGFHQAEVNPLLKKHWPAICPDPAARVFVPLCGKTLDMTWLAERGHDVVGVELSRSAADDYFSERGLTPDVRKVEGFEVLFAGGVSIWVGDFFEMPDAEMAQAVASYDRASLIALPQDMRVAYARKMAQGLSAAARVFLLTITYPDGEMSGPPFSVQDDEVQTLFGGSFEVQHLESRDATQGSKNLTDRGASRIDTSAFDLVRRSAGS